MSGENLKQWLKTEQQLLLEIVLDRMNMTLSNEDLKEFSSLLSQDLENGDTDKVVELFKYNKTLYETLGKMLSEGSMFVRLGVNMLLEDLSEEKPEDMKYALPQIIPLLQNENATIRGDAADIIGMIGSSEHISILKPLLEDEHSQVREIAAEAIKTLEEIN